MKTFTVIDLNRLGSAVTAKPSSPGREVLVADEREDHVQRVTEKVIHAVTNDARDPSVLRAPGARNYDCAAVAVGGDIGNSALITPNLREIGVKQIICKVQNHVYRKVLEKIGVDRVILPEHEVGVKLTQGFSSSNVLNLIELNEDPGVVEIAVPKEWHYGVIQNLDVRARYKVNIIAMRRGKGGALNVTPGASYVIEPDNAVVVPGCTEGINHPQDL